MSTDQVVCIFSQIGIVPVTNKIGKGFAYKMNRDM